MSELPFKILLVGDSSVGKSSVLIQFVEDFDSFDTSQAPTIGVDFKTKKIVVDNKSVTLNVWDTAGQEKFRSLTASYYKSTQGILLAFDVCSRKSFQDLEGWLNEIRLYSSFDNVAIVLIGNKIDRVQEREVSKEEAENWCKSHNDLQYYECSAKTKDGINQAFEGLVRLILSRQNLYKSTKKETLPLKVSQEEETPSGGCWC